jgi:protein SCO1/2
MEPETRESGRAASPLARAVLSLLLVAALVAMVWTATDRRKAPADPLTVSNPTPPAPGAPEPRPVPPFRFTDQEGKPFGLDDLKGKVWIANFMFSRCTNTCPLQAAKLEEIARVLATTSRLSEDVRLVSFSLDSKTDTPEVLRGYAELRGVPAKTWRFLTGSGDEVARLSEEGFQLGASGPSEAAPDGGFVHSDRFVLVDARGIIRGYYRPTTEPADMDRLMADVKRLAGAGPAG